MERIAKLDQKQESIVQWIRDQNCVDGHMTAPLTFLVSSVLIPNLDDFEVSSAVFLLNGIVIDKNIKLSMYDVQSGPGWATKTCWINNGNLKCQLQRKWNQKAETQTQSEVWRGLRPWAVIENDFLLNNNVDMRIPEVSAPRNDIVLQSHGSAMVARFDHDTKLYSYRLETQKSQYAQEPRHYRLIDARHVSRSGTDCVARKLYL